MAALIERLLAKDREQRPQTAKAVADELAVIEREAAQATTDERTVQMASGRRQPAVAASNSRLTPAARRWLVAASLLLLLGGVAAAIVVIIRDKDGKKIVQYEVPPNGTVEVQDKAKKPPLPPEGVKIEPEPLAPRAESEPLSANALVLQPAKLPCVRGWSIVTRETTNPSVVACLPDSKRLALGGHRPVARPHGAWSAQQRFDHHARRPLHRQRKR